jgi:hypothetical protein
MLLGKILKIISKSQPKKVEVTINGSSVNHNLMKNVHNLSIKGSRLIKGHMNSV